MSRSITVKDVKGFMGAGVVALLFNTLSTLFYYGAFKNQDVWMGILGTALFVLAMLFAKDSLKCLLSEKQVKK